MTASKMEEIIKKLKKTSAEMEKRNKDTEKNMSLRVTLEQHLQLEK